MKQRKPGEPPDFRTLDDPDLPPAGAESALPGALEVRGPVTPAGYWHWPGDMPSAWRRFWVWLLLGWKWKNID